MRDVATVLARSIWPALHDGTTAAFMFKRLGQFNDVAYQQEAERFSAAILATPEGKALAALVEAALAWRDSVEGTPMRFERPLYAAIDAYREATR